MEDASARPPGIMRIRLEPLVSKTPLKTGQIGVDYGTEDDNEKYSVAEDEKYDESSYKEVVPTEEISEGGILDEEVSNCNSLDKEDSIEEKDSLEEHDSTNEKDSLDEELSDDEED
jgi:hypothetical protein